MSQRFNFFITTAISLLLGVAMVAPLAVSANYVPQQVTFDPNTNAQRNTGLGNASPTEITQRIIQIVLSVLALLALVLVIYGGYIWMLARGNEEEVGKAKAILEGALFGLVVVLASYGITSYVFQNLINITNNS